MTKSIERSPGAHPLNRDRYLWIIGTVMRELFNRLLISFRGKKIPRISF